jgi:uncharacterized membrane protein YkvA (DUF1232 family)
MVRAALRGQYPALGVGRLLALLGGLLYVVSPVDLVPEALFSVFGLADDAMVITWMAGALLADTEAFLTWERGRAAGAPQDATRADWTGRSSASAETVRSHVVR